VDIIVNHDPKSNTFLTQMMAHMIQCPGISPGVAMGIMGVQGSFKSMFFERLFGEQIIGRRYFANCSTESVLGHFNSKSEDKVFISLPELRCDESYKYAQALQRVITDAFKEVTNKGRDSRDVPNYARIIATFNPSASKLEFEIRRR
jgi:hypothetical protein